MGKIIILICAFAILSQVGCSQNLDQAKLDDYLSALETNNKFMGSVAISKNGTIIYSKIMGYSDVENNVKAQENSKYRVGSISKTFTAVLILKAVEENKLNLSQTIDEWFPTIKNAKDITIAHLLYHRSGIRNFTADGDYLTWNTQPKTEEEMIAIISKTTSVFQAGSRASYSNSNFVLLTYILEKIHNTSYAELLEKYIAKPAGLNNTYLGGIIKPYKNECKSYNFLGDWKPASETDISIALGAGGIASTAIDLTKFSHALFSGKLLKSESLEKMKTIQDNFGLGLLQMPFYDKMSFGHSGGIDGFAAVFSHFSDGDISYALTSNGVNYNINEINLAVLSAVYNKPYEIPAFTTFNISPEDLDKYL